MPSLVAFGAGNRAVEEVQRHKSKRPPVILRAAPARWSQSERRLQIIDELYRIHASLMRDQLAGACDVDALPRDQWLNDQLARLGEAWRVQNVDGFRYEIYDVGAQSCGFR